MRCPNPIKRIGLMLLIDPVEERELRLIVSKNSGILSTDSIFLNI
jgi:hypothetical protein